MRRKQLKRTLKVVMRHLRQTQADLREQEGLNRSADAALRAMEDNYRRLERERVAVQAVATPAAEPPKEVPTWAEIGRLTERIAIQKEALTNLRSNLTTKCNDFRNRWTSAVQRCKESEAQAEALAGSLVAARKDVESLTHQGLDLTDKHNALRVEHNTALEQLKLARGSRERYKSLLGASQENVERLRVEIDGLVEKLTKAGICPACGKEYKHHMDEPFASCDCGTTEWGSTPPLIHQLRHELAIYRDTAGTIMDAVAEASAARFHAENPEPEIKTAP